MIVADFMSHHPNKTSFKPGSEAGKEFRFEKGQEPWNKGVSVHLSPQSEFKPGEHAMEKHPQWKGQQDMTHDVIHITTAPGVRTRRPKIVYEKEYGEMPKGFIIYHINGDMHDDRIENLVAIIRQDAINVNCERKSLKECETFPKNRFEVKNVYKKQEI